MRRASAYTIYTFTWLAFIVLSWLGLPYLPWPLSPAWKLFASLNIASFALFAVDKIQAQTRGGVRVPEYTLYAATLFGGSIGALASMWLFRHKTRKIGFQVVIAFLVLLHVLIFLRWQDYF
jgi:uncharacterized membrane protein YsdA (DUF1294 family)